jgi:hypothetical protein
VPFLTVRFLHVFWNCGLILSFSSLGSFQICVCMVSVSPNGFVIASTCPYSSPALNPELELKVTFRGPWLVVRMGKPEINQSPGQLCLIHSWLIDLQSFSLHRKP